MELAESDKVNQNKNHDLSRLLNTATLPQKQKFNKGLLPTKFFTVILHEMFTPIEKSSILGFIILIENEVNCDVFL
ncbi:hypothetical protein HY772_06330 [Candidatus Woesearchaeota archaeon]|nr:hypothetical protein [Candidatus Woesearchaeota archaeon]